MGEPMAIKETPQQQAMRKEQERVRRESHDNLQRNTQAQPTPEFGEPFIFRVKMWANGSFSGLWQLEALNKQGKVEQVISDADTLPNILATLGNVFENRGF